MGTENSRESKGVKRRSFREEGVRKIVVKRGMGK